MSSNEIGKKRFAILISALVGVSSFVLPAAVLAQEERALEEVVVTAQKRAESMQDVPLAITTLGEDFFRNAKVTSIAEILPYTPGLTGHAAGGTDPVFAIRAISTNAFGNGSEPSIGIFLDDSYIGRNLLAASAFFDLERIEVVKGPQGTLFGRNAAAGAINAITKAPELGENSAHIGVGAGNYEQAKLDIQGNLAVSDKFAIRIAGLYDSYGGIQTNDFDNTGVNDKDMKAIRVGFRYQASDSFDAILRLQYTDYQALGYSGPTPGLGDGDEEFPDVFTNNVDPNDETVQTTGANLRLVWDLNDSMTLTSISDYRKWETDFGQDVDGVGFWTVNYFQDNQDAETFGQEFRLDGGNGDLTWFVGGSYFYENIGGPQELVVDGCTLADFGFVPGFDCAGLIIADPDAAAALFSDLVEDNGKYEAIAAYADLNYQWTEKLAVTVGGRLTRDEKDFTAWAFAELGLLGNDTGGEKYSSNKTWTDFSPRLVVDYQFTDTLMGYVSASKGYKSGGFNTAVDTQTDPPTIQSFDPEENITYELGWKSTLANDTLRFNGAVYYMDYKDLQVETLIGALPFVNNVSDAIVKGIELEVTWAAPVDGLTLTFNGAYMDHEYTNGALVLTDINGNPIIEILDGRGLNAAPATTVSAMVDYDIILGNAGSLRLFAAYNYQSEMFYDISNADYLEEPSYSVVNARITYSPTSDFWDVSLVGENLGDQDYAVRRQDPLGFGTAQIIRGTPQFYRLEANFYF